MLATNINNGLKLNISNESAASLNSLKELSHFSHFRNEKEMIFRGNPEEILHKIEDCVGEVYADRTLV